MSRGRRNLTRTLTGAAAAVALSVAALSGVSTAAGAAAAPAPAPDATPSASPSPLPTGAAHGFVKSADGSFVTGTHWVDSHMLDFYISSKAVGTVVPVRLIVPKGWSRTGHKTFPTLYVFHGGLGQYTDWTDKTDVEATATKWSALTVLPDGGQHGSYTNWFNNGKGGTPAWETFHTSELIQIVERNFHGSADRAAMGISSGGQGAVTYQARHPGLYRFVASYSSILHMTMAGIPSIMMATSAFGVTDPFAVWGNPFTVLGAANWAAHDPYDLAQKLKGTGLFISSGTTGLPGRYDPTVASVGAYQYAKDFAEGGVAEKVTGATSQAMVAKLRTLGIPVTSDFYTLGWHQWPYWNVEYKKAWPLIMKAIGGSRV